MRLSYSFDVAGGAIRSRGCAKRLLRLAMSRNCVNNLEANRRGANDGAGGFGIKIINRATAIGNMTISLTDPFTYTRGLDLSGQTGSALSGAGGIGGLLARTDGNGTTYYHSDGNGNVTMLVNSAGTMQAQYLYDPYGNTLGMWGPLAVGNTYRFSSKEIEPKSGIYYHGYRYYEPNLQRWLNRDPIAEFGGINLYEFNFNSPPNYVDPDGKHPVIIAAVIAAEAAAAAQLSVDYQKEFGFSNHDKAQAIANNDAAMAKLQEIIDSNGDKTFQQEGLGVGGVLGTQLPGSKCQKFRNLFESLRNIEGYPSAANELGTRIANNGTGAQIPTEDQQTADQRAQLAKAWLARGQAFDRWAKRLF